MNTIQRDLYTIFTYNINPIFLSGNRGDQIQEYICSYSIKEPSINLVDCNIVRVEYK